jgi:hypothetical protein
LDLKTVEQPSCNGRLFEAVCSLLLEGEAFEMETGEMEIPLSANEPEQPYKSKFVNDFAEKLAVKDAKTGMKVKDAADNVGLIGVLGALLLGFLLCDWIDGLLGIIIGLTSSGVLVCAAILLAKLLNQYGDMILINAEQIKILEQLEKRKALEAFIYGDPIPVTAEPGAAEAAENTGDTAEQPVADTAASEEPSADDSVALRLEEQSEPAFTVDIANRIAYFLRRPEAGIECPICGQEQLTAHSACPRCGCQYIYGEDELQHRKKKDIECLRKLLQM